MSLFGMLLQFSWRLGNDHITRTGQYISSADVKPTTFLFEVPHIIHCATTTKIKPMHQHDLESMEILAHNEATTKRFFHYTIPNTLEHISVRGEPSSHTPRDGVGILIKPSMPCHDSAV